MKKFLILLFIITTFFTFIAADTFITLHSFGRLNNVGDIRSMSMGLRGISLNDNINSSTLNPALATKSDRIIFNLGETYSFNKMSYNILGEDKTRGDFEVPYLNIVFPLPIDNLALSAHYNSPVNSRLRLEFEQNNENIIEKFNKNINFIQSAVSYKVFNYLSLSTGMIYIFGNEENSYKIYNGTYYNKLTEDSWEYQYEGYGTIFGANFNYSNINVSLSYRPAVDVNINKSFDNIAQGKSSFEYPQSIMSGISYYLKNSIFSIEYITENWANLDYEDYKKYEMEDMQKIAIGFEHNFEISYSSNTVKKNIELPLRAGFYYQKGYYKEGKEYGLTIGTSVKPFNTDNANFDIYMGIGKREMFFDSEYEETYFTFGASLRAYDKWYK
ncbi:MAG: hypothetical protein FXF47_06925 [Candidatus Mcinerneyibacterium aminivorans]|uniref:Long-chain fatty acid transport protein n=1 Tax=Candidatus Mcinerneyibacterium aminivorans TaxID=2703815 RepID=A0A5D0MHK2_9BACT|nr:MAG: hypothetical protein FXF47_06925 [Candidatus Mcinerneyibacterium aminivorans]